MLRFYNGRLCTFANHPSDEELWVEGDRIAYIGSAVPEPPVFSREIDLGGDLLLPTFKNAHSHSAMTFLRSAADDLPLADWLQGVVFPAEARLREGDIYALSQLAILEYLEGGIGAGFDMYRGENAEIAAAAIDLGFRMVLCGAVNDFCSSVKAMAEDHRRYRNSHPLISHQLGFHGEYTCSEGLLREVAALAADTRSPVYCHLAETKAEVAGCRTRYDKTPTAFLESIGMFDHGGGGFHCVHMTCEDLDIFQQRGLFAITNPASNCKLASGIPPLSEMHRRGIPLAIGTDGPASNNCLDFFREMFLVTALQKLREEDAAALPAEVVLKMATVGGANAMGLSDCDVLAVGKQADLQVIDLSQPNMRPIHHPQNNLVYAGNKKNVRMTMVAGQILYENGIFSQQIDAERIRDTAEAISHRIAAAR